MSVSRIRRRPVALLAFLIATALLVVPPSPLFPDPARAASFLVCPVGDGDSACTHNDLASAVVTAVDGDDIVIKAGTFVEASEIIITENLTIVGDGTGLTFLDGGDTHRVLSVAGGADVVIEDLTIQNGVADSLGGGGIRNTADLTLRRIELTGNDVSGPSTGYRGGAIHQVAGSLVIEDSSIHSNTASWLGGGIAQSGGDIVIRRTTISSNDGVTGGGGFAAEFVAAGSTAVLENVTLSGNIGGSSGSLGGGGLYLFSGGDVTLNNVTVTGNTATVGNGGGGIVVGQNDTETDTNFFFSNTIIAGNTAGGFPDCRTIGGSFTFTSLGNNIMGATDGCSGYTPDATDQTGTVASLVDAELAALADNGGFTQTHAILGTSPARNAGNNLTCEAEDQRGTPRPQETTCDIGAFELEPPGTLQDLIDTDPDGIIEISPGTYNENITIGDNKTLRGLGANPQDVVIQGTGTGPTVTVGNDDVTFENLTITGGSTASQGGGILVDGSEHGITLTDVRVIGNDADGAGGGMFVDGSNAVTITNSVFSGNTSGDFGGAIFLGPGSTMDIINSSFESNAATLGGGAIFTDDGVIDLLSTVLDLNDAIDGDGGAIGILDGELVADDISMTNNSAAANGGGLWIRDSCGECPLVTASIINSDISNNTADMGGGVRISFSAVVDITSSTVGNNDATTSGGGISVRGDLDLIDTDVISNDSLGIGGGVTVDPFGDAVVTNSTFDDNAAIEGGGIHNGGDLTIAGSTLVNSTATETGGAIHSTNDLDVAEATFTNNNSGLGGGIYNEGDLILTSSSLVQNGATDAGVTAGGGILVAAGTADITNSTFSANSSAGNGAGLGVTSGVATVNNVSFVDNGAAGQGGALNGDVGSTIYLSNSLSDFNSAGGGGPECSSIVSLGYNILGSNAGGCTLQPTDIIGAAGVDVLADNGGPTETHALVGGSPAIDGGNPFGNIDIGAFDAGVLADWTLNGTAELDGSLLLADGINEAGTAFSNKLVAVDQDFAAQFQFQIPPSSSGGADGISFVIGDDPTALGEDGGRLATSVFDVDLGTRGIIDGVTVEFDTWVNGIGVGANDPDGNHIGINLDGDPDSIAVTGLGSFPALTSNLSDGSVWTAWVDYDAATTTLEVRASPFGFRPFSPNVSATVDIAAQVGGPTAYVGFAGATGNPATITGEQRVLSFSYQAAGACEPVDQRGVARPQGPACDIGAVENTLEAGSLSVSIADAGPQAFDTPIIPIDDLDIGTFFGAEEGPGSTQLGAIQLGAIQLGAIDNSGLTAAGGYLTIGSIIEAAAEFGTASTVLDEITLVDVSIVGGWEPILALSANLAGRPPYTVSLRQVIDDAAISASTAPPLPLEDLRLADSGLAASQLGAIQLGAIQLGAIQLGAIGLEAAQLGAILLDIGDQLADLCAGGLDCAGLGINPADETTYDGYSIMALTLLGVELDFAQLGAIQLGAIDAAGSLEDIQLGAIQLGAIDTTAGTIGNTQLGAIQLGAIQLGAIQLGAIQLGAIGSKAGLVAYWCNDPAGGLDCGDLGITEPTGGFVGDELDSYSLVALGAMGADLAVLQLGAIQLGAIDNLESTQLGAIQLGAISNLSASQLGAIQLGAIQLGAIQLGAIDFSDPVFAQLGAIQLGAIQLGAINADGTPVPSQLGAIQLGAIGDPNLIVDCTTIPGGCTANGGLTLYDLQRAGLLRSTASLADLAGALEGIPLQVLADAGLDIVTLVGAATIADLLPETTVAELPPDVTLGDLAELWVGVPLYELLLALLDPAELNWEDVDAATLAADNPVLAAGWAVGFTLTGDAAAVPEAEFPFTADVSVTLPSGVTYIPGTSTLAVDPAELPPPNAVPLADPEVDGSTLRWIIDGVGLNEFQYLEFGLSTAFTADADTPIATTVNTLGFTASDESPTFVLDVEPNDTFAEATDLTDPDLADVVILGRIDPGGDVDIFKLDVAPGGSIEVYLNPGDSDLDIVLFEPGQTTAGELRGPVERIVDGSLDPTVGVDEQDQESLDDIVNSGIAPVFKASLHRDTEGETIVTPPLREGGPFYLQVSGYDVTGLPEDVYVGRIRQIAPPAADACAARVLPFDGVAGEDGVPGTLPADLAGAETLYLINTELFADTYGATALGAVIGSIGAVTGAGAPPGVVVPVEGDPAVATAYANWLGADGNCSVTAANAVARAIATLVDGYRATYPIENVVIVGGDDQVPFFRVEDETTVANEREYETTFTGNNPLDASLRGGYVLTDAPMVDANPLYVEQGDREIFIPTIAIGRLVEDPVEIVASLEQYVVSGGLLDAVQTTALPSPPAQVFGYDFLSDSSANIAQSLIDQNYLTTSTISESWTRSDLIAGVDTGAALINVNAHFDHTAALPAAGNASGAFTDLYTVEDLQELTNPDGSPNTLYAGSTIYGMGCHAGLNAPGAYLDPTDDLYDWAQALLARQAIYIANTGFGYGDSDFQAYSEEFMALLTEQFATSNTIGEAHLYAAQIFAATTPKWSPYHDKAVMEATLYGLPFYRLQESDVTPPPIPTIGTAPVGGAGALESAAVSTSSPLATVNTDDGDYLTSDDVLAVPFRPVQPLEFLEVTPVDSSLIVRGAVIEGGTTSDLAGFDVLYARPILWDQDAEVEVETAGAFPNALQSVTSFMLPNGRADRLLLARGRYFPSQQTQQRWDSVDLTVYYGPDPLADPSPPEISLVQAVDQGGGEVDFSVQVSDSSGVLRVLVLYKESGVDGAWTALQLALSGDTWAATATGLTDAQNIDYFVQAVAVDGQVATSSDKAELHDVAPPSPPGVDVDGELGNNGIFRGNVAVSLTDPANSPGAPLEISTDAGNTFEAYTGAVVLAGDGTFEIVGRPVGFPDSSTTTTIVIDTTDPVVNLLSPAPGLFVDQDGSLPLEYFCEDNGSGIAKCEGSALNGQSVDTSEAGPHVAQVTATDRAGNTAVDSVSYTVLPVLQIVAGEAQPLNTPVEFSVVIADLPGTTVEWDWGDGSPVEAGATSPGTEPGTLDVLNTHAFASPGPFTITLTVDYGAVTQTATVEYSAGLAPDIVSVTGPVAPIPESTTASVTVVFEDDSEAHTVTFDWGDGSSMTTVNLGPGEFEASASHPYFDPDAYTVTVTVTDATGLSDTETVFVVVYDPNGRRMWGLGDVDLDADHNLGFGFFVRNTKWFGPKGAFAFDVDNCSVAEVLQWQCIGFPNELVFVSTDVDEFYVLGDWAVATGTGYIVGDSGTYDWALVVGDESPDEIRVRIRDASDPSIVVFDTNPGDWVFTEPTIDIDSGIIKIVTR